MQNTEMQQRQAEFVGLQQDDRWQQSLGTRFDYVFLVYPGRPEDLVAFCPPEVWASQLRDKNKLVLPAGIIQPGKTGVKGLLVVTGFDMRQLMKLAILKQVLFQLDQLGQRVGAKSISLAGLLPSIVVKKIEKDGLELSPLFVRGLTASTWLVSQEISALAQPGDKVGVIGVGYLGRLVIQSLISRGFQIAAVDLNDDPNVLKNCSVVVALTPTADDILQYADLLINFKCRALLSDCHPRPSKQLVEKLVSGGVMVYQTVATADQVVFQPRLPGYRPDWIPGCALDALVRAGIGHNDGEVGFPDFDRFASRAYIHTPAVNLVEVIESL